MTGSGKIYLREAVFARFNDDVGGEREKIVFVPLLLLVIRDVLSLEVVTTALVLIPELMFDGSTPATLVIGRLAVIGDEVERMALVEAIEAEGRETTDDICSDDEEKITDIVGDTIMMHELDDTSEEIAEVPTVGRTDDVSMVEDAAIDVVGDSKLSVLIMTEEIPELAEVVELWVDCALDSAVVDSGALEDI